MNSIVNPLNIKEVLLKLESRNLEHSEFIGIVYCIIHSKEIFHYNRDINPFLEEVFGFKYLQYVLNSRTLLSAKIAKYVLKLDNEQANEMRINLIKYLKPIISDSGQANKNKKKNANDKLNIWLKGL
ncbi:hypothetical protein [Clostridium sp. YIM B02569]|uniref:hypothetical protein n=1 Tax=Clostridium sp. YIM B02569 TaxID=2911967 RepID=UPI001EECD959|nr:hypothetical protein [Clostridium sp. YIM B02569]